MASEERAQARNIIESIRQREWRLLIVDDDDAFRRSFSFLLKRKFNTQVEEVDSGVAAMDRIRATPEYDLIFIDMMMPIMSGVETYRNLRKLGVSTRIVIMSAYTDSEEWSKAQLMSDVILVHKPIAESDLLAVLGSLHDDYEK